jgi:hypothetical protein
LRETLIELPLSNDHVEEIFGRRYKLQMWALGFAAIEFHPSIREGHVERFFSRKRELNYSIPILELSASRGRPINEPG